MALSRTLNAFLNASMSPSGFFLWAKLIKSKTNRNRNVLFDTSKVPRPYSLLSGSASGMECGIVITGTGETLEMLFATNVLGTHSSWKCSKLAFHPSGNDDNSQAQ